MAIGPIEGSAIPLMQPHEPFATQVAPKVLPKIDAANAAGDAFVDLLAQANARGHAASDMAQAIAEGRSDDIHGTMLEMSKAGIETKLLVNVKDKIMEAFHELWRMNV